ncbi:MAG: hypothetical protein A2381_01485 [Bdellovibrionales bacterium RIFOXYB1_FULL_37_110]|nr:MAG: hypothetical protein A2417_02340 [Bdellovibrionales bacterium RIFOXYC1_FULL_37_79]OFZ58888.1 MAG: hypothetical protein A2381_01485 [Bdellovibrionales bacterium RIFOXYB1_FULL_37_110]OFZ64666.1 MAG: hypothetical protein A2577_13450 [Bdellovibrionales bacterium RIFOXYD1_FULL_36_51]
MLNLLEKFLLKLYQFAVNFPRTNLALFLTVFGLFSLHINQIKSFITTEYIIEKNSIQHTRLIQLKNDFYVPDTLFTLLVGDLDQSNPVCKVHDWIQDEAFTNKEIESIYSPFHVREVISEQDRVYYPKLLRLDCPMKRGSVDYRPLHSSFWRNTFIPTTKLAKNLGVEILFRDTPGGSRYGKIDPKVIKNFKEKLSLFLKNNFQSIESFYLGSLGMLYYSFEGINNTVRLNILFLLAVIILFRIFFGTFRSGIMFSVTLLLMGGMLYGTMGLVGAPIDILNTGVFLMVSVSALEDFVFLSAERMHSSIPTTEIFKKMLLPGFFTSLTTIIGFGSLCFTDMTIIQRFGFYAAYGSLIEWLMTFLLLPSLIKIFPRLDNWADSNKAILAKQINKSVSFTPSKYLTWLLLFLYLSGGYFLLHPQLNDYPFDIFPKTHSFKKGMEHLQTSRGWEVSFDLIFKDYENKPFNLDVLRQLRLEKEVVQILDSYSLEDYYTKGLKPLRKALINRDFKRSHDYKRFVSSSGSARSIVYIKKNLVSDINKLISKIRQLCQRDARCYATGEVVAYADFANHVPAVLLESFKTSIFLVGLVIFILALSLGIHQKINLILSSLWGPFAVLTFIGIAQISINVQTCIFAGVIVGLTGDNAIQYLFATNKNNLKTGIVTRGLGSIQMFIIMATGSLIFQFAYFQFTKDLGLLIILGMFLSLFGDLWILNSLIGRKDEIK